MRYLLGELGERERAEIERAYFEDAERFQELEAAEAELIDAYVRGELLEAQARHFKIRVDESRDLTERVELARSLARYADVHQVVAPIRRSTGFAWKLSMSLAAAVLVLTVGGAVLWRASHTDTAVTFALRAGLARGPGDPQIIDVPRGSKVLRLHLDFDGAAYAQYRAVIRTADGSVVWQGEHLLPTRPGAPSLDVEVPAGVMTANDYVISLSGARADGADEKVADFVVRVRTGQ